MLTHAAGQPRELALRLVLESEPHGREYFDHHESLDELLAALRQVLEESIAIAAADRVERIVGVAVVPREDYGSEDGYGHGLELPIPQLGRMRMTECLPPVVINVSGGVVQDVFAGDGNVEAIVVDWDTEGCAADERGIIAIPDKHGGQQLAAVMCHRCVPLGGLEGTDAGHVLRAAGRPEVLTVAAPQNQPVPAQLTDGEVATVLAALRHWQRTALANSGQSAAADYPHFDEHEPLSANEVDELCERLNFADSSCLGDSTVLHRVPSATELLALVEDVVRLVHGDRDSGRLTDENTLAEHSGADFLDALNHLLSSRGIEPRWEKPTIGEDHV